MKLKETFVTYKTGDSYVAVTANENKEVLNGMVRNNETADFIFRQLAEETTEEQIVEALLAAYDVERDVAAADVHRIVTILRDEGLIDG